MSLLILHPDFKLQGKSFDNSSIFLDFIFKSFPDSYSFLKSLFDESDTIESKTSGSTGKPKTISILKKAMLHSAEATGVFFDLPAKTKALHCLSSNNIAGKMMWVRALYLGWHLKVVKPSSYPLKEDDNPYDFAAFVPLQAQNSLSKLSKIKKIIIGGAPISYDLEKKLESIPTKVFHTYGMTETITHVAVRRISNKKTKLYKGLPKVQFSIDNRGCLQIDAPRISKNLVITNDIVKLYTNSQFEWIGRIDNVINSGGIKLFPEQIEKKLATIIKQNFIIASLPDSTLGNKVILIIESYKRNLTLENISSTSLSKYEKPKEIYFIEKFTYTLSDKIDRLNTVLLIDNTLY